MAQQRNYHNQNSPFIFFLNKYPSTLCHNFSQMRKKRVLSYVYTLIYFLRKKRSKPTNSDTLKVHWHFRCINLSDFDLSKKVQLAERGNVTFCLIARRIFLIHYAYNRRYKCISCSLCCIVTYGQYFAISANPPLTDNARISLSM